MGNVNVENRWPAAQELSFPLHIWEAPMIWGQYVHITFRHHHLLRHRHQHHLRWFWTQYVHNSHHISQMWNTYVWDYLRKFSFSACPSILAANEGYLRRGAYSRHIGRDKRLTELSAIISQNAKAAEILAPMQWSLRTRTLTSQKKKKRKQLLRSRKVVRKMTMMMPKVFAVAVQKKLFSFPCPQKPQFPLVEKEIAKKNSLRNNCIQLLSKRLHRNYALSIVSWKSEMNLNMTVIVIMRNFYIVEYCLGKCHAIMDYGLFPSIHICR